MAHASAWTSRRYARGRSSRAKIAVPATSRSAPASWAPRIVSGPIPPSTWSVDLRTQQPPQLRDPRQGLRHERLARVAGLDAHAEHEVDVVRVGRVDGRRDLGLGLEREPDLEPLLLARAVDDPRELRAGLEVHRDAVRAGLRELGEVVLWRQGHQVHVDDAARVVDRGRDVLQHDRPDRDRRDEPAVADVVVEDAGTRAEQDVELVAEPREVGRVDRRLDLDGPDPVLPRHAAILGARPAGGAGTTSCRDGRNADKQARTRASRPHREHKEYLTDARHSRPAPSRGLRRAKHPLDARALARPRPAHRGSGRRRAHGGRRQAGASGRAARRRWYDEQRQIVLDRGGPLRRARPAQHPHSRAASPAARFESDPTPDRAEASALLRRVAERQPELLGVWVAFEPDGFDGRDAEYVGDDRYGDVGGRFTTSAPAQRRACMKPFRDFDPRRPVVGTTTSTRCRSSRAATWRSSPTRTPGS